MNKSNEKEGSKAPGAEEIIDLELYTDSEKKVPVGKKYRVKVDDEYYIFDHHIVTGREILEKAGKVPIQCHTLYMKLKHCDFEKISPDERVDLAKPGAGIEKFVVKEAEVFNYTVNDEPETTDSKALTPKGIMRLAGINPEKQYLVQLNHDGTETCYAYESDTAIKMVCIGMKFVTREWLELIDIEEHGKTCKKVVPARKYRIKVDKEHHLWDNRYILPTKIIEFSQKTPIDKQDVWKFYGNEPKPVKADCNDPIDLFEKCLLRFVVLPKEQKDGREMVRNFTLPQEDVDFLDKLGFPWETLSNGGMWLIIHNYPIPFGYNVQFVTIALMISPSYPAAEIDMAFFHPHLQKQSGKAINAISPRDIDGKSFQQWSRHRQPGEWVPGVDNISTHLGLVDNWLLNDLKR